jgi:hypothetical protein
MSLIESTFAKQPRRTVSARSTSATALWSDAKRGYPEMDAAFAHVSVLVRAGVDDNDPSLIASSERAEELSHRYSDLCARVVAAPAATLADVLAKLECAAAWIEEGRAGVAPQSLDVEDRAVLMLCKDVRRMLAG